MVHLDGIVPMSFKCRNPDHKDYKAVRVPTTGCVDCMQIYNLRLAYIFLRDKITSAIAYELKVE